jgi:hypothetical protein
VLKRIYQNNLKMHRFHRRGLSKDESDIQNTNNNDKNQVSLGVSRPTKINYNKIKYINKEYPAVHKCRKTQSFYEEIEFTVQVQLFSPKLVDGLGSPDVPQAYVPFGDPVDIKLKVIRTGHQITLFIPGISVSIPEEAGESFLQVINKYIPKRFRPTTMNAVSFDVGSNVTSNPPIDNFPQTDMYQGNLYRDGTFQYSLEGGYPIPPGQLIANATSVIYTNSKQKDFPANFVISTWGVSNASLSDSEPLVLADQFAEYDGIDIQNGKIVTCWGDNSHTPATRPSGKPGHFLNLAYSKLKYKNGKIKQIVDPEYLDPRDEYQLESTISISRANTKFVAALSASLIRPRPVVGGIRQNSGNLYALSTDGGDTFTTTILGRPPSSIPGAWGADTQIEWDRFNNLWMTYLHADPTTFIFTAITVGSPNGDPTKFRVVDTIVGVDPRTQESGRGIDYPWMRVGPDNHATGASDGGRPEAVWSFASQVIVDNYTMVSGAPLIIHGFRVFGKLPNNINSPLTGIVGPVREYLPPTSSVGGYGDIAIGINGDVLISNQSTQDNALFDSANSRTILYSIYNPNGLDGDFGNRQNIGYLTEGWFEGIGPQANRNIQANVRLAVDRSNSVYRDRIYAVVTDKKKPTPGKGLTFIGQQPSDGQVILLTWTDNKGITWADPIQINNDPKNDNSHFNGAIGLDQSNGNLIISWRDARCDPGDNKGCDTDGIPNTDVNWVGSVVTVDFIEAIEKSRSTPFTFDH